MSDIFVSYATKDLNRVMPLVRALQGTGWSVFWDRTIPTGKIWRQVIGSEIDGCRCMVVVWSTNSIESNWVHEEAEEGQRRNILVPVLVEDVKPPMGFRSIQAAKLAGWDGKQPFEAFDRLLGDITMILGKPPAQEAEERQREVELASKREAEEEAKRAREKAAKAAEEKKRQAELEAKGKAEEEAARAREKATREAEERQRQAELATKRKAEEEAERVREKAAKHEAEEAAKRAREKAAKEAEEKKRQEELEAKRKAEDEASPVGARTAQPKPSESKETSKSSPPFLWFAMPVIIVIGLVIVWMLYQPGSEPPQETEQVLRDKARLEAELRAIQQEIARQREAEDGERREAELRARQEELIRQQEAQGRERREAEQAAQQREAEIARLLDRGTQAEAALHLTTPVNDNAADHYREVLRLDHENPDAQQGLQRIVERYLGWAEQALAENRLHKAETNLAKAASVDPDHPRIRQLTEELAGRQQRQAELQAARRAEAEPKRESRTVELAGEMVPIEGGCFLMGSPIGEEGRDDDERQHRVCVENFRMGKYEVTQAQWRAVMGDSPSYFEKCDDCPVGKVSWNRVQEFIAELNARTGKRYRLPTEVEWEYACRGGRPGERYCGGDDPKPLAWYLDNSGSKTHPVGGKRGNGFGLYDMSGNAYEWTCSAYEEDYRGAETKCVGAEVGAQRVVRGGSWGFIPGYLRSATRFRFNPGYGNSYLGFRLAQDL